VKAVHAKSFIVEFKLAGVEPVASGSLQGHLLIRLRGIVLAGLLLGELFASNAGHGEA
jgi:hypothetical protein